MKIFFTRAAVKAISKTPQTLSKTRAAVRIIPAYIKLKIASARAKDLLEITRLRAQEISERKKSLKSGIKELVHERRTCLADLRYYAQRAAECEHAPFFHTAERYIFSDLAPNPSAGTILRARLKLTRRHIRELHKFFTETDQKLREAQKFFVRDIIRVRTLNKQRKIIISRLEDAQKNFTACLNALIPPKPKPPKHPL